MWISTIVNENGELLWVAVAYSREIPCQQIEQVLWRYTDSKREEEEYLHAVKIWQKREKDDLGYGKLNITHINENIDMCRTLNKYKY